MARHISGSLSPPTSSSLYILCWLYQCEKISFHLFIPEICIFLFISCTYFEDFVWIGKIKSCKPSWQSYPGSASRCKKDRKYMEHRSILAEARCDDCDRFFRSNKDLNRHKKFCSRILFLKNKAEEESGVPEEGIEDEPWLDGRTVEYMARLYADTCLTYLNEQDSHRQYKLVKPGNFGEAVISGGPITHFNFKANANDGPVETFFAQLKTTTWPNHEEVIDFCVPLGPSQNLPHWRSAYLRDCCYCNHGVHHPYPGMACDEKLKLGTLSILPRVYRNE